MYIIFSLVCRDAAAELKMKQLRKLHNDVQVSPCLHNKNLLSLRHWWTSANMLCWSTDVTGCDLYVSNAHKLCIINTNSCQSCHIISFAKAVPHMQAT